MQALECSVATERVTLCELTGLQWLSSLALARVPGHGWMFEVVSMIPAAQLVVATETSPDLPPSPALASLPDGHLTRQRPWADFACWQTGLDGP